MLTEILDAVSEINISVSKAVECLKSGMPVAFPTETVYGIGAGIFDINTVEQIFRIKGRNFNNPLSAHVSNIHDAEIICRDISDDYYLLAEKLLPGPISIVMKKKKEVSDTVTGGGDTISVRIPDNNIFHELSKKFGQPIAATSANKSGNPSPVTALHVYDDLKGGIPVILDGGKCIYQIESTVISLVEDVPVILRPGVISQNKIEEILGKKVLSRNRQIVLTDNSKKNEYASKYRILYFDNINSLINFYEHNRNRKLLVMTRNERLSPYEYNIIKTNESTLFQDLRDAEKNGIELLLIDKDEYIMSSEVLRHRLKLS